MCDTLKGKESLNLDKKVKRQKNSKGDNNLKQKVEKVEGS